jgi:hypothetical protein
LYSNHRLQWLGLPSYYVCKWYVRRDGGFCVAEGRGGGSIVDSVSRLFFFVLRSPLNLED